MASVAGVGTKFSTCSIQSTDTWVQSNDPPPQCIKDVPAVWMNADSEIALAHNQQTNVSATTPTAHATHRMYTDVGEQVGAPSTSTDGSALDAKSLASIGLPFFFAGLGVAFLLHAVWQKCQQPSSKLKHLVHGGEFSPKTSPSPTNAHAMYVAPSAPSTPMAGTVNKLHEKAEESAPLTAHHTQYNTRAKRRPSLGTTSTGGSSSSSDLSAMSTRIPDTIPSESPDVSDA